MRNFIVLFYSLILVAGAIYAQEGKKEVQPLNSFQPNSAIYAGVGLNSSGAVAIGFDKSIKKKGINFLTAGAYFAYDRYNVSSFSALSIYTIGFRQTAQIITLVNNFLDAPVKLPIEVYVGFQEGYRLAHVNYKDPSLRDFNSIAGGFIFQPVMGVEYYFLKNKLGAYFEVGRTTGAPMSVGLKMRFGKKEAS